MSGGAARRPMDGALRLKVWLATGFGIGYAPVAPGTVGSVPGALLAWSLFLAGGAWASLAGCAIVTAIGFWAAGHAAQRFGATDPRPIVVDEIAGQMLSLVLLRPTLGTLLLGFFLFRLFDVWKPFPVRLLESLPGGSGIMADDLAAGVYANLVLEGTLHWAPGLLGQS